MKSKRSANTTVNTAALITVIRKRLPYAGERRALCFTTNARARTRLRQQPEPTNRVKDRRAMCRVSCHQGVISRVPKA
jgi:hypothetical protein